MGWGHAFTADLYISKEMFRTIYEIEEKIRDTEDSINRTKSRLKMYAISTLKDVITNEIQPIDYCDYTIEEEINDMLDDEVLLFKLNTFLEMAKQDDSLLTKSID